VFCAALFSAVVLFAVVVVAVGVFFGCYGRCNYYGDCGGCG
jgi:hypothetical protein